MIFKQIDEILSGQKTQTRRVCKPGQFYLFPDDWPVGVYSAHDYDPEDGSWSGAARFVYIVARTYAVCPKRGAPAVLWREKDGHIELAHERPDWVHFRTMLNTSRSTWRLVVKGLADKGWHELRIRITAIRQERLQDITEADAKAEGVASVEEYRGLWERINGRTRGARWADNPDVWVLQFELVQL